MSRLLYLIIFVALGLEASDQFPGGSSTTNDWSKQAFNHPHTHASAIAKQQFGVGNSFFKLAWVQFPSSTVGRDGLGPTYNAVACASCHVNDGRGIGYINNKTNVSLLFRFAVSKDGEFLPHPNYGNQFQPFAINGVSGEGSVDVVFENIKGEYPDGSEYELRKPMFTFKDLAFGEISEDTQVSPRVAPHLVGLGLIEAISEADIITFEDPEDEDGDGVSGKAHWVYDERSLSVKLGRFGWKAEQPTVEQQNAAAFNGDMGLTSSLFPQQNCPLVQIDCQNAPTSTDLEVTEKVLERVTTYMQLIAVPKARNYETIDFAEGKKVFNELQCQQCHRPSYQTGSFHNQPSLNDQFIWPYSDFLLHDMGEDLSDKSKTSENNSREWRTPPLWSIGLIPTVNNHSNLLHDGRARNVEEAILWHGGEAQRHKENFKNLNKEQRNQLIYFLNSI